MFITNRGKTLNEKIYYNVDKIHDVIEEMYSLAREITEIYERTNKFC